MEEGKQYLMQNQQQQLLLQQIQRQKDAISRFPSNIDAHLRPHQALLHQRSSPQIPNPPNPNHNHNHNHNPSPNPNPNPISAAASGNNAAGNSNNPQQHQHFKASLQLAYQDALRVCRPDFKRPFSSLEDACERLLPYHVVADYEAEEDDRILDSDANGQVLSRSQQWDQNIASKASEFTATFEKQVLAFNIISHKRARGEFRTEEKLMMEQFLLQDEKRALFELRAEMDSRQKVNRDAHEANMRMAAMVQEQVRAGSQAHAGMMGRVPIRASARGSGSRCSISASGPDMSGHEQDDVINDCGINLQKDEKEPSEDFLNDDETENGDTALQGEWHGGGELDLNAR